MYGGNESTLLFASLAFRFTFAFNIIFHLVVGFDYIYYKLDGVGGLLCRTNNVLSDWPPSIIRGGSTVRRVHWFMKGGWFC